MNLSQLVKNKIYIISQVNSDSADLGNRFFQLGVYPGAEISLKRKAPIFRDPIIFQIEGSQIVLTRIEASLVEVQKEDHNV